MWRVALGLDPDSVKATDGAAVGTPEVADQVAGLLRGGHRQPMATTGNVAAITALKKKRKRSEKSVASDRLRRRQ